MPKRQEKPLALKREHPVLKNMKILDFFLFLWVIFALMDPDPDPATQINADPDPKPCFESWYCISRTPPSFSGIACFCRLVFDNNVLTNCSPSIIFKNCTIAILIAARSNNALKTTP